jgi:hypothetical protein
MFFDTIDLCLDLLIGILALVAALVNEETREHNKGQQLKEL